MVHDCVDEQAGFGEGERGHVLELAEFEVDGCFFFAARTLAGAGNGGRGHQGEIWGGKASVMIKRGEGRALQLLYIPKQQVGFEKE